MVERTMAAPFHTSLWSTCPSYTMARKKDPHRISPHEGFPTWRQEMRRMMDNLVTGPSPRIKAAQVCCRMSAPIYGQV